MSNKIEITMVFRDEAKDGYREPFTLTVLPEDTIAYLKGEVVERWFIAADKQRLVLDISNESPLDDEQTLLDCGFKNGGVMMVYRCEKPVLDPGLKEPFDIKIRPDGGKSFMLEVCRSDTMGRLKKKIQEEKGYSARHSTFGQADEDDKTLDYYHFDETVTLKLWPKGKRRVRDPKLLDKSRMNPPAAGDTQGGSGGSDGEDATAVGDTQGGSGGSHGEDVSDKFGESSGKAEERGLSIRIKKD